MVKTTHAPLLVGDECPAAEVLNPGGAGPVVLVCEHASARIPAALGDMGLGDEARISHAAWDAGAFDVAKAMSRALNAPLVASRVSRLVYDCNRPPDAPSAIVQTAEYYPIPANEGLSVTHRAQRVAEVYDPFMSLLSAVLDARPGAVLVSVHSFTPIYFGSPRAVELGLLHDADDRLALTMLAAAGLAPRWRTELNAPYDASDGVTHTLRTHAVPRGLLNVMIEIRSDLIDRPDGAADMAAHLSRLVRAGLSGLDA